MHIARDIRRVLHEHGVHSTTIQPEFHDGSSFLGSGDGDGGGVNNGGSAPAYEVGHVDEEHLVVSLYNLSYYSGCFF